MKNRIYIIIIIFYISSAYALIFLPSTLLNVFTNEDGIIETLGALYFLGASIIFIICYRKDLIGIDLVKRTNRNLWFLLLGILFFVGFGEEISWGQRIFGIQTPEMIADVNTQNEINIHNLSVFNKNNSEENTAIVTNILNVDRLFSLFWLTFCIILPVSYKYSTKIEKILQKLGIPIVPIYIGIFFLINYSVSKLLENMTTIAYKAPIVEIKESIFAFLFLIISIWFYKNIQSRMTT